LATLRNLWTAFTGLPTAARAIIAVVVAFAGLIVLVLSVFLSPLFAVRPGRPSSWRWGPSAATLSPSTERRERHLRKPKAGVLAAALLAAALFFSSACGGQGPGPPEATTAAPSEEDLGQLVGLTAHGGLGRLVLFPHGDYHER